MVGVVMSPSTTDSPRDPDDLRRLADDLRRDVAWLRAEVHAKALMIEKLRAQLAVLRRARFGRKSEKLDAQVEQLELLIDDIEAGRRRDARARRRRGAGRGRDDRDRRLADEEAQAFDPRSLARPFAQGFEQSSETADPARHDRTVDLNAAAGVDVGLTIQRQMIAELRHDDMGEQRRARAPLLDRQRRHRRLDDGLAGSVFMLRAAAWPVLVVEMAMSVLRAIVEPTTDLLEIGVAISSTAAG